MSPRCPGNRPSLIPCKRGCFSLAGVAVLILCCGAVYAQTSPADTPATATANPVPPEMAAFQRARLEVDKFFEQATNVVCTENVSQAVVGKNGKVNYREDSVFDYQLQSNPNGGSLRLLESRDTRKAAFRDSSRTLLITNGFTSMLLIMHPSYESSYTFEPGARRAWMVSPTSRSISKLSRALLPQRHFNCAATIIPFLFREQFGSNPKAARSLSWRVPSIPA